MESIAVQLLLDELETARESLDRAFACLITVPLTTRSLNHELLTPGESARRNPTIKFITENGFAIERVCDREGSTNDSASGCHFVVSGPDHEEHRVTVAFDEAAIQLVQGSLGSTPLPLNNSFWLCCAERSLATYLWEKNCCPPGGRLTVDQLSDEDLRLAIRFN